jgi:hypothetical protein
MPNPVTGRERLSGSRKKQVAKKLARLLERTVTTSTCEADLERLAQGYDATAARAVDQLVDIKVLDTAVVREAMRMAVVRFPDLLNDWLNQPASDAQS